MAAAIVNVMDCPRWQNVLPGCDENQGILTSHRHRLPLRNRVGIGTGVRDCRCLLLFIIGLLDIYVVVRFIFFRMHSVPRAG
jgi:hypothetical protein